jgi:uncharacterized repeat protein (TIGR04138 family)
MPTKKDFSEVIRTIRAEDPRYAEGAYHFVRQALDHTISNMKKQGEKPTLRNHVSGQQLLNGIRVFALDQYGPMAKTLLDTWNITKCEDFGEIVFNLVEHGILGKTDEDSREDFTGGYTFKEAFIDPFVPKKRRSVDT